MAVATYTLEEVRKHNQAGDVWIILNNKGGYESDVVQISSI